MTTQQAPTVVEKVYLICTQGTSNKYYDIELQRFPGDLYMAVGYNGGIIGTAADPQTGKPRPQSAKPVPYAEARAHFDALEKDKRRKYRDNPHKPRYVEGGEPPQQAAEGTAAPALFVALPVAAASKVSTGVGGFLPKPIDDERARELIHDDDYDASQKLDGEKLYATLRAEAFGTNKLGFRVPLAPALEKDMRLLARVTGSTAGISLDGEEMGAFHSCDLVEYMGVDLRALEYERRQETMLHISEMFARARAEEAGDSLLRFVRKASTTAEKLQLMLTVERLQLEGVVFAHKRRPGVLFKWKNWRTIDCVVVAHENKQSLEGFVYHGGQLLSVGNINLSAARHAEVLRLQRAEMVVAEIKCIYASGTAEERGQIQQPSLLRIRTDKLPHQCTGDQLLHCLTQKIVVDWTLPLAA